MVEQAKVFTRLIETGSPLGDFYIKIELNKFMEDPNHTVVISSYKELKDLEPVFAVSCTDDPDMILKTVQEVSQAHLHNLMDQEKEDLTKFFINRGFKPEYPRIIS